MSAKHVSYCSECGDSVGICEIAETHTHAPVFCEDCTQAGYNLDDYHYFRSTHFASVHDMRATLAHALTQQAASERGVA